MTCHYNLPRSFQFVNIPRSDYYTLHACANEQKSVKYDGAVFENISSGQIARLRSKTVGGRTEAAAVKTARGNIISCSRRLSSIHLRTRLYISSTDPAARTAGNFLEQQIVSFH